MSKREFDHHDSHIGNNKRTKQEFDDHDDNDERVKIMLDVGDKNNLGSELLKSKININPRVKLVLLGDGQVGKSTFVSRFEAFDVRNEPLNESYCAKVISVKFLVPLINLEIWYLYSVDGSEVNPEKLNSLLLSDECVFLKDVDCAMIMFSVVTIMSYKNIPWWYRIVNEKLSDNRVIICGTKADNGERRVRPKVITFHRKKNLKYFDTSSIANYNVLEPVQYLVGQVFNEEKPEPCEILKTVDTTLLTRELSFIEKYKEELKMADEYYADEDDF